MTTIPHNKIDRAEFAAKAAEGLTPAQLAAHFGTRLDTVSRIRNELGMTTRRRKAPVDRQELLRLHEQGKTTTQIAQHFGANVDSISRIKGQLGISARHDMTEERLARVAQMVEDGWSYAEIHRTEGISYDSLRRYFPGKSWTQEQTTEYLQLRRLETGRHFNERNNRYRAEHRARTHPYGATKHTRTGTLDTTTHQQAANRAQGVQHMQGRVIGRAA